MAVEVSYGDIHLLVIEGLRFLERETSARRLVYRCHRQFPKADLQDLYIVIVS